MTPQNQILFDSFDFSQVGIVFTDVNYMEIPKRNNQIEKLANRDGGVLVQSLLDVKEIELEGYYIGTSITDAKNMYDTLTQVLNRQQRTLEIPHGSTVRKFLATPQNLIISQPMGLNRITFSFSFVVPDGSSYSDTTSSLVSQTITTATATIPISVLGSVKARPRIILYYTAISGGTGGVISLRNAKDFVGLTFTGNFVTGDEIIIDSENFQIYKNGTPMEPNGRMPSWEAGSGSIYYSDTFSTRTLQINGTYIRRDL